jgi:hypothetical protein
MQTTMRLKLRSLPPKKVIIDYLHWCNHDFELAPMVVLVHTIHHSNNNGIIVETVIDSYLLGLQTTLRFS